MGAPRTQLTGLWIVVPRTGQPVFVSGKSEAEVRRKAYRYFGTPAFHVEPQVYKLLRKAGPATGGGAA